MILERVINLESLQWWLQFGLAVISFAGAVGGVLMWLLKRYRKTLQDAQDAIKAQRKATDEQVRINEEQAKQIQESIRDRKKLRGDVDAIMQAQLASIKIDLDKLCAKAIKAGCVTIVARESIDTLFGAYEALKGNHGMAGKVKTVQKLPVCNRKDDSE